MATSLTKATEIYNALEEAYLAVLSGSSYSISVGGNTRTFTRQNMKELRSEMQFWSSYISKLNSGKKGVPVKFGTPYE